ncbi:MAG: hypothetical protein Q8L22_27175 [Reyranella sp.]|nr:hypothetical protein [Reyranella sp.]
MNTRAGRTGLPIGPLSKSATGLFAGGATQFIFPNGMALRFDLEPGQYVGKQQPHINLQLPGVFNEHIKLLP